MIGSHRPLPNSGQVSRHGSRGKAKLKKGTGTIVRGPIDSLSKAGQRFIGIVP
jgi:hypothetical protein